MKKEYAIFIVLVLVLVGMFLIAQFLTGTEPTGFATRPLSSKAPIVILIAFGVAAGFGYIAWKISRSQ